MSSADAPNTRGFTAKGVATRDRILRCAADVLLDGGLTAFSLDRVRQAARVSGSQLNHYFGDRNELIRAVLRRQTGIVLDFHRQAALGGLDTFADWERWADLNVRYLRKIGYRGTATYHALAGQLAKTDEGTRKTFADGYWRWVALLEDCFARMKSRGLLVASADPDHLALVVVAVHQGAGVLAFTYRQEWPLVDATQFIVNYLRLFAKDPQERRPRPVRRTAPRARPRRSEQRPEARRLTRKGLATRARIIEGAAELVLRRGVNGTSLDDVRSAVGVSGSQMSHYFSDKQDLLRQIISARTEFVVDFHTQPQLGRLDTLASLRSWAELCWAQSGLSYLRNGCVYGSLTGELLEADDVVLDDLADGYDRWLGLFRDGLHAMVERHELRDDADPRHLAAALVVAHQGGTMLTHITGSPEPFKQAVEAALGYVASFAVPEPKSRRSARTSR
ncbi:TetR family transcriptional regulator [Mycolicibacterium canariasense]|uniref:TetR family transcriptional regulator n=1 Tax=Mycolicibacterium canariasense TaxID=228230 RepID=A0A100WHN1_MYCCR|nr:TetR/AcrR family transcriptional regulator [Mycolicibacterium canariasense]MCV7212362.1 TetR/AcrR family transcriptional regulator [Mycolicibacterium canariasense]ORV15561.1 TetR family transcriptional regulator [Mycolicibacterium canariasense]GAS98064.1 TetR family transcriptional regulator [Mycolicibacterium canariasense]